MLAYTLGPLLAFPIQLRHQQGENFTYIKSLFPYGKSKKEHIFKLFQGVLIIIILILLLIIIITTG